MLKQKQGSVMVLSGQFLGGAVGSLLLITTTLVAFYSAFQKQQPPRRP